MMRVKRRTPTDTDGRAGGVSPLLGGVALNPRSGFTLIELLVVMIILVILTTMTVYAVNFSLAAERSRSAARQVQSYLEGARDRAIYERRPVGVRFLIDPNVADTASSMVYVEELPPPTGIVTVSNPGGTYWRVTRTSGGVSWQALVQKELILPGTKIKLSNGTISVWHTIQGPLDPADNTRIDKAMPLGADVLQIAPSSAAAFTQYEIQLAPVVRPNQEPMLLPRGIVVDLDRSQLPTFWRPGGNYISQLDVLFSPRGNVAGRTASTGLIHFYLAEAGDVERIEAARVATTYPNNTSFPNQPQYVPSDTPYGTGADDDVIGDRVIVTVFPQTGAISSHPVDPAPIATTGINAKAANDPFKFAELGEVAGE